MKGITSYGVYLPRLRLGKQAMAEANAWFDASLKGLAKGERSICNWDEDTITMAVEATTDCLSARAWCRVYETLPIICARDSRATTTSARVLTTTSSV